MSYVRQTWHNGDIIAEELLNHMEAGIADCSDRLDAINIQPLTNQQIDNMFGNRWPVTPRVNSNLSSGSGSGNGGV